MRKQPLSGHRKDSEVKTCSKLCVTVKLLPLEKVNWSLPLIVQPTLGTRATLSIASSLAFSYELKPKRRSGS